MYSAMADNEINVLGMEAVNKIPDQIIFRNHCSHRLLSALLDSASSVLVCISEFLQHSQLSRDMREPVFGVTTKSDTN